MNLTIDGHVTKCFEFMSLGGWPHKRYGCRDIKYGGIMSIHTVPIAFKGMIVKSLVKHQQW